MAMRWDLMKHRISLALILPMQIGGALMQAAIRPAVIFPLPIAWSHRTGSVKKMALDGTIIQMATSLLTQRLKILSAVKQRPQTSNVAISVQMKSSNVCY